ncbi:MAG: S-layer homology domain-containing protein [Oscillospiraceae bacterium]|nr:S-layer homology domain-containing protein [Oscillospiraceae bacterium]
MKTWKRGLCTLLVLCIVLSVFVTGAAAYGALEYEEAEGHLADSGENLASGPFLDVSRNDWFFTAVHFVSARDIMSGPTALNFAPNGSFSRGMVVATLFRIHHGRTANATDPRNTPFHDVAENAWYAPYVSWAHRHNIADGLPDGRFAPNSAVQRQQFAAMLHRYVLAFEVMDTAIRTGPQWGNFVDRDEIAPWAYAALAWANYHGIVTGRDGNRIAPEATALRAEAATMLTRFLGGNAAAPPPSLPASVEIADLLDADFRSTWYVFGDLHSRLNAGWEMWRFRSGVTIGVDGAGKIASIAVDYTQAGSGRFNYSGLNNMSTPGDVRAALGDPTVSDGTNYVYWLGGEVFLGPNLLFAFNSHTGRVEVIGLMHMP